MLMASKLLRCQTLSLPCILTQPLERGRGGAKEPASLSKVTGAARGTEELVPASAWCPKVSVFHLLFLPLSPPPGEMGIQPKAKERHLSQPEILPMSPGWG